jgi:hypothetical protein
MTGHTGALMATSTLVKNTQGETLTLIPHSVPLYGSSCLSKYLKYRCAIKMKPASIPQVLCVVSQFVN